MLKKKFMIFHYPQRKIENLIADLKFNSQTIERVSEFIFLGLTIDECLSWKPHVQKSIEQGLPHYWYSTTS